MTLLRIGSRGSQLALWQANHIAARLRELGTRSNWRSSRPRATRSPTWPWPRSAPRACSPRRSKRRWRDGRVDLAVHSLKDLPTELPAGIRDRGDHRARESARRVALGEVSDICDRCRRRARWALAACAARRSSRCSGPDLVIFPLARQCRHARAQAGRGRVRRHRPGGGRTEPAGQDATGEAGAAGRLYVSRRRARERWHRDSRAATQTCASTCAFLDDQAARAGHHLRASSAEQAGRRLPGSDRRFRRGRSGTSSR